MSAWRLLVKSLHQLGGGPLRLAQFDEGIAARPYSAMLTAENLGLVTDTRPRKDHGSPCIWQLTELGEALCEGRAKVVRKNAVLGTVAAVVRTIGDTVDDATIERVMLAAGHEPGAAVTLEVLRAYSDRLAAEVRKSVMA